MRMEEADAADEFVLVAADADDEIAHEPRVRVLAGGYSETSLDANYFAVARRRDAFDNDEVDEAVANASEGSGDADDDDEEEEKELVVVEEQEVGGGDHGWQQHAVGVLCSIGLAAATAAGLALLPGAGGGRQKPAVAVNFRAAADYKAAKVAARRGARLDQGISVARAEHAPAPAPAVISFGSCRTCNDGKMF
uniref:DUF6821 domain-containing protein n=1 Tax=Oryza punctata TaxID=4537 RepID=A0A0E0LMI9_ORYPU